VFTLTNYLITLRQIQNIRGGIFLSFDFDRIVEIALKYSAEVLKNESMSALTSFKIGGAADLVFKINSEDCLKEAVVCCGNIGIPFFVLGKGSNVLVSDAGFRGIVFVLGKDFSNIEVCGEKIICDAGTSLSALCKTALSHELSGLEFAYGIPGTVGGALYMNAGAYGGEIKDVVEGCRYIDLNDSGGEIKEMPSSEMNLSYRHSIFSETKNIITSVSFFLKKGNAVEIECKMNELLLKRKEKQPLEYPSAGSTFKRPDGDFASRLVDVCGLKGRSVGGAEVSAKHSGFIINKNNASFSDVISLIKVVKKEVYKKSGVTLECEPVILE
jgi:UDP-N-acetylmuramate dehydrogenase